MKTLGKHYVSSHVIIYEAIGFIVVTLIIWLNELLDIPFFLLGAEPTPSNWRESVFETVLILLLGGMVILVTRRLFRRMKYLEGTLPVCACCKKIRDEHGNWRSIESYISDGSDAVFSHGICPECAEQYYPEYNPYKKSSDPTKNI